MTAERIGRLEAEVAALDRERAALAGYVRQARSAIAGLAPEDLRARTLPQLLGEMQAVTDANQQAAETIMSAAERVLEHCRANLTGKEKAVSDNCIEILEACSFEDIAGQRVRKVVRALMDLDDRLAALEVSIAGQDAAPAPSPPAAVGDAALMNGPAPPGAGVTQDEVDRLMV